MPIIPTPKASSGQWIGHLQLADGPVCVRLTLDGAPDKLAGTLDLPAQCVFRIPLQALEQVGEALHFRVDDPALGALHFDGTLAGDEIVGEVVGGVGRGAAQLQRIVALDEARFGARIGVYQLPSGQEALLTSVSHGDYQLPCYAMGDHVVRLYPIAADAFVSEELETLRLVRDAAGAGGLDWQPLGGPAAFAARVEPYRTEDVTFANGAVTLAGTLLLPLGAANCPAVAFMHGSLPSIRDFYRIYADRFARHGIAALIYDKRGYGSSSGDPDSTLRQRAEDAAAALSYLRGRPEVDAAAVGVWAFSNGTWSAPLLAAQLEPIPFLVVTGAVGVSGAATETHRKLVELRDWGVPAATLARIERGWELTYACLTGVTWQAGWDAEYDALVAGFAGDAQLRGIPLADYAVAQPILGPVPPLVSARELRARYSGQSPDLGYDPAPDYERIHCPVFFIAGAEDPNLPAAEGARRVEQALARGGNPDATVRVVPGAGHMLEVAHPELRGMGAAEAAGQLHAFRYMPDYLAAMPVWVLERTRPGA